MPLGQFMSYLDEPPPEPEEDAEGGTKSNQDWWMERRATVIDMFAAQSFGARLTDDMCTSTVTVNEEEGLS